MAAGGSSGMTAAAICKAVCVLQPENTAGNHVSGILRLTQTDVHQAVTIQGQLTGLTPGRHGIAIAQTGDISAGAASCGPVFNPFGKTHGAPSDAMRMVGDLGNIMADDKGHCNVNIVDPQKLVQLLGPHSVIGRSIILYASEDDQGRGGHENSLHTGNPGPRIAAGVIGLAV